MNASCQWRASSTISATGYASRKSLEGRQREDEIAKILGSQDIDLSYIGQHLFGVERLVRTAHA
jgi:hypothetical protein